MRRRLVLLTLLVVVLSACTPGSDDSSTTSDAEGPSSSTSTGVATSTTTTTTPPDGFGGELVVGQQDSITSLNPFAPDFFGGGLAGNLIWATVYDIEPTTWQRVPDLVTVLPRGPAPSS